jgi:hypothetical protein
MNARLSRSPDLTLKDGCLSPKAVIDDVCRFRFQYGTGRVREINVLREVSPATFSVSIETEATFLLFQLGLVGRAIVFSMSVSCSSATRPTLEAERRNIFAQLLVSNGWTSTCEVGLND